MSKKIWYSPNKFDTYGQEEIMCMVTTREDGGFVQICNCLYGSTHCQEQE